MLNIGKLLKLQLPWCSTFFFPFSKNKGHSNKIAQELKGFQKVGNHNENRHSFPTRGQELSRSLPPLVLPGSPGLGLDLTVMGYS